MRRPSVTQCFAAALPQHFLRRQVMKQLFTRLVASGSARLATILTVAVSLPLALLIGRGAASGQTLQALVTKNPGTMITPAALDTRQYPLPGGGEGTDLYIKQSAFHDAFAGDLPLSTTNLMWAEQRPFSFAAFTEPSGDPAWK